MSSAVTLYALTAQRPLNDDRWIEVITVHTTKREAQESQARLGGRGALTCIKGMLPDDALFFQVAQSADQTEGRGPLQQVVVMTSFLEAIRVADGRGNMGFGHGQIRIIHHAGVCQTAEDFWHLAGSRTGLLPNVAVRPENELLGLRGLSRVYFAAEEGLEPLVADPEWAEYVRLQTKFSGR